MKSGASPDSCLGWGGTDTVQPYPYSFLVSLNHTQRKIQDCYSLRSHTLEIPFDDAALYCSESVFSSPRPCKRKALQFSYVFF